ncbi:MAG: glycosyltransferase family 39 protein [Acidobacteria bacterium]|nr:glycosyltransferase family 39 protein [Acidobacteriota bacterium]
MKKKISIALLLTIGALGFRFWLALGFPNDTPGDTVGYAWLAKNTLKHQVYSKDEDEPLQPTYYRVPGYPLFLLLVYAAFGEDNQRMARIVQSGLDTLSCWLVALLVLAWSPPAWEEKRRQRAMFIALGLMACCPFTAIYTAVVLTEVLVTMLMLGCALSATRAHLSATPKPKFLWWLAAGVAAGAATMVRPDAGLFAAGVGVWLVVLGVQASFRQWRTEKSLSLKVQTTGENRTQQSAALEQSGSAAATPQLPAASLSCNQAPHDLTKRTALQRFAQMIYSGAIFSVGFALMLTPWTIRNARVFGVFQPLAPASANMPDEFVPQGYNDWLRTWVDREAYTEKVDWPLGQKRITVKMMPAYAFDSQEEKARVAALLERYNHPPQASQATTMGESSTANQQHSSAQTTTPASPNQPASPSSRKEKKVSAAPHKAKQSEDPRAAASSAAAINDANDNDHDNDDDDSDAPDEEEEEEEAPQSQPATVMMTPEIDAGFAQIASERKARHPFRYYVITPLKRARYLWFSTHSEYYPFAGELDEEFDTEIHQQFWLPLFLGILWLYTLLAMAGAVVLCGTPKTRRWLLLVALLVVPRFAFLTTMPNPEPRYVVEFFPLTLALCAIALAAVRWRRRTP